MSWLSEYKRNQKNNNFSSGGMLLELLLVAGLLAVVGVAVVMGMGNLFRSQQRSKLRQEAVQYAVEVLEITYNQSINLPWAEFYDKYAGSENNILGLSDESQIRQANHVLLAKVGLDEPPTKPPAKPTYSQPEEYEPEFLDDRPLPSYDFVYDPDVDNANRISRSVLERQAREQRDRGLVLPEHSAIYPIRRHNGSVFERRGQTFFAPGMVDILDGGKVRLYGRADVEVRDDGLLFNNSIWVKNNEGVLEVTGPVDMLGNELEIDNLEIKPATRLAPAIYVQGVLAQPNGEVVEIVSSRPVMMWEIQKGKYIASTSFGGMVAPVYDDGEVELEEVEKPELILGTFDRSVNFSQVKRSENGDLSEYGVVDENSLKAIVKVSWMEGSRLEELVIETMYVNYEVGGEE